MKDLDTSGWEAVGETSNSRYFVVEPHVLAALPNPASTDTKESAEENVAFQNAHWKSVGHPGVVVVFFDNMTSQDAAARRVYQTGPEPDLMLGTALVGGSLLSRAMGSFFLGLTKPAIPVKMFRSLAEAKVWADELVRARKERE